MAWKLFYDGGCNLCHASKLQVEKWAEKRKFPLQVDILASDYAISKGYGDVMTLETPEGVFYAEDAWLKLISLAPFPLNLPGVIARVPLFKPFLAWIYRTVARNRIKWFGARSCQIPPREV